MMVVMTIIKRNRLIRRIASALAERAGREARRDLDVIVQEERDAGVEIHRSDLAWSETYEDAARNLYAHLAGRRVYRSPSTGRAHLPIGLPAIQRMLGEARS